MVEPFFAGVGSASAEGGVEISREVVSGAAAAALGLDGSGFNESRQAGESGFVERPFFGNGVQRQKVVSGKMTQLLLAKSLQKLNEFRIAHGSFDFGLKTLWLSGIRAD